MERIDRSARIERAGLNKEARQFPLVLSSAAPLPGRFGQEILDHSPSAVTLPSSLEGVPLIVGHDVRGLPVGRIKALRLDGDKLVGTAHVSRTQLGTDVLNDIEDGILTDVSVGAEVTQWDNSADVRRAIQWAPIEGSLVSVALDPNARINRDKNMPDESKDEMKLIRRAQDIKNLFTGLPQDLSDLHIEALENSELDLETVRSKVLERMKASSKSVTDNRTQDPARIASGADAHEKFMEGIESVITLRCGLNGHDPKKSRELDQQARQSEFYGASLGEISRAYLRVNNVPMNGLSADDIADKALIVRAGGVISHSPGDFANLLGNTASKKLAQAYEETPRTFSTWTGVGSLADFKQADVINTSSFSDVDDIVGDEEYTYGTLSDKKETAQLATVGKLISIGRRTIVNDDLDGLSRTSRAMGRAVARRVNRDAYGLLTSNPTMNEDSVALFDENTHDNLVSAGPLLGPPTIASLDAAFTAMAKQRALAPGDGDPGAILNLAPTYLIAPKSMEFSVAQLLAAAIDPSEGTTTSFVSPNPFRGRLTPVHDAELDEISEDAWYLAASPTMIDTIDVFYLNGVQSPFLEQQEGFTRDGITWKIRFDFAVAQLDWRGLAKNNGA